MSQLLELLEALLGELLEALLGEPLEALLEEWLVHQQVQQEENLRKWTFP